MFIDLIEQFINQIQIVAIVLAAVGICLMAYDSGLNSFTFVGILLAVVASITAAIYKVIVIYCYLINCLGII
jgi:hypothetical protein